MSSLGFWTWISIAVLIGGPLIVFVWFLRDAVAIFREAACGPVPPVPSADDPERQADR